jgi:hypothetical protein
LLTDHDSRDPLMWLSRILWTDGSTTIKPGGTTSPHWWASPSTENPKILIPAQSMGAAKASVKRYHDGFSSKLRARSLMAEAVMGFEPLARLALRSKLVGAEGGLRVVPPVDDEAAGSNRDAAVAHGGRVLDGIAELLGVEQLHVAVSLSTPKSNQKPVLQLLDDDGVCLGWAKVAWNDRTEALVATEADWLRRPASAPLSKPQLLHDVTIAGRRVVIGTGVEPGRRPRRRPDVAPPAALFDAVARLGTVKVTTVTRSRWWDSVESVLEQATARERTAIDAVIDACRDLEIRVGAWHGDLTPWNLMTGKDRIHLIDWEFAADGVPYGFDLCHFHTQVGSEMKGFGDGETGAALALDYSARMSPHGLAQLGVAPENRTAIWRLYLVELMRRTFALRADGYPTERVTQGAAALERIEKMFRGSEADHDTAGSNVIRGGFFAADDDDDHPEPEAEHVSEPDADAEQNAEAEPDSEQNADAEPNADADPEHNADAEAGTPIAEVEDAPSSFAELLAESPRQNRNGATAR